MQGTDDIAEIGGWGATTGRKRRGDHDNDGPRLAGSDLLAFACSRSNRLDPRDGSSSFSWIPPVLIPQFPLFPFIHYFTKVLSFYNALHIHIVHSGWTLASYHTAQTEGSLLLVLYVILLYD